MYIRTFLFLRVFNCYHMKIAIYQVDAFTNQLFGGNPAAVCPLNEWITDEIMQSIAAENNLSETVFFVVKEDNFEIRWFMPYGEIDLCGHATLAAAYVIFNQLNYDKDIITFQSQSGALKAVKANDGGITLDFPSRPPKAMEIPLAALKAFNHQPVEASFDRDLVLLFDNESQIRTLMYNLEELSKLPYLCIIATARGENVDFVSRVFDAKAIPVEDPVTGSAHTSLIPYWRDKLNKSTFKALQLSDRVGELECEISGDRVYMTGKAVLYLKGEIYI